MAEDKTEWSGRAYTWSLVTYADTVLIKRLLAEARHWAWCYHDKDTNEDGTPKEPHTHIIVTFEQQKSLQSIKDILQSEQNTFGECRRKSGDNWVNLNVKALFDYLIHEGRPDKYPYDPEERHFDSEIYWKRYFTDVREFESNREFVQDLTAPYKNLIEMDLFLANKYGKDYIKNRLIYHSFRSEQISAEIWKEDWSRYDKLIQFCIDNDISSHEAIKTLKRSIDLSNGNFSRKL